MNIALQCHRLIRVAQKLIKHGIKSTLGKLMPRTCWLPEAYTKWQSWGIGLGKSDKLLCDWIQANIYTRKGFTVDAQGYIWDAKPAFLQICLELGCSDNEWVGVEGTLTPHAANNSTPLLVTFSDMTLIPVEVP